ncbi:MAG TPA: nuclear transport factor 2 family protein [Nitrososphaerales archaeon]|nr:nuclear transport factor 2 family protein [Nitrososphaerales archaeon]
MGAKDQQKEVVMSYIRALDSWEYDEALDSLHERVRIKGPAGETFGKPKDFIGMLRKYKGKYEIKKVFADGNDVCVLYDLATKGSRVYMSSWYRVEDGKIVSIETIFDSKAMGPPPGSNSGRRGAR